MPGILFNNIWMLTGLAALSVPLIIHLLLRRKTKRMRFSSVQFFLKQDLQSSQRRKLRNWLLLCLRLLICALLVCAFARPYLQSTIPGALARKHSTAIVLDRSLSMQAEAGGKSKWSAARESVRGLLEKLQADDRACLIDCVGPSTPVSAWAPPSTILRQLETLDATFAAASLGEGLEQAVHMLAAADAESEKSIYIVSDLQQSSCENVSSFPIPKEVTLKTIHVGDLVTPNLAITDLRLEPSSGLKPYLVVSSFTDEEAPNLKVELTAEGRTFETLAVTLAPGASTNLEFNLPRLSPGWHDVAAKITSKDGLAADNARYQSIYVPKPARVLVVEPNRTARSFEEDTFFVAAALEPSRGETNGPQSRFNIEKVAPDDLSRVLANLSTSDASGMVVLPGLKQLPSGLGDALTRYVRNGGGLLIFLGNAVNANRYHAELRELLPVQLGATQESAPGTLGWQIGEYQTNSALFGAFQLPGNGKLSLAHFTKRQEIAPTSGAKIMARFNDEAPFIVASSLGLGRIVLVNASADTSWNDWPKHKTYVPWLHGTGQYLTLRTTAEESSNDQHWIAGTSNDLDLGIAHAKKAVVVRSANGEERRLIADDRGQLPDISAVSPGFYSLRDAQGVDLWHWAANVPSRESALTALAPKDFEQSIARAPEENKRIFTAGLLASNGNQRELWRVLLMAALALLFLELLIANRTNA